MNNSSYHIFFKNLSNSLKISIILSLRDTGKNVSQIIKDVGGEQSKISHALGMLKKCNIVKSEQKGKERIYFLNKDTIIPMLDLIDVHARKHCNCKFCTNSKCQERKS